MSVVPGSVVLPEVSGPIREHGAETKPPIRATIYFFIIANHAKLISSLFQCQLKLLILGHG